MHEYQSVKFCFQKIKKKTVQIFVILNAKDALPWKYVTEVFDSKGIIGNRLFLELKKW